MIFYINLDKHAEFDISCAFEVEDESTDIYVAALWCIITIS